MGRSRPSILKASPSTSATSSCAPRATPASAWRADVPRAGSCSTTSLRATCSSRSAQKLTRLLRWRRAGGREAVTRSAEQPPSDIRDIQGLAQDGNVETCQLHADDPFAGPRHDDNRNVAPARVASHPAISSAPFITGIRRSTSSSEGVRRSRVSRASTSCSASRQS